LPAEVEAILRFVSENQRLSGFRGKITPKTVQHRLKLYRQGKPKSKKVYKSFFPTAALRETLFVVHLQQGDPGSARCRVPTSLKYSKTWPSAESAVGLVNDDYQVISIALSVVFVSGARARHVGFKGKESIPENAPKWESSTPGSPPNGQIVEVSFQGANTHKWESSAKPPRRVPNAERRSREYLTEAEVQKLISAAEKCGRHGHRDGTMNSKG
jgi:hypothetical protein